MVAICKNTIQISAIWCPPRLPVIGGHLFFNTQIKRGKSSSTCLAKPDASLHSSVSALTLLGVTTPSLTTPPVLPWPLVSIGPQSPFWFPWSITSQTVTHSKLLLRMWHSKANNWPLYDQLKSYTGHYCWWNFLSHSPHWECLTGHFFFLSLNLFSISRSQSSIPQIPFFPHENYASYSDCFYFSICKYWKNFSAKPRVTLFEISIY